MDMVKWCSIDELFARADADRQAAELARQRRGLAKYDPHWLVIRLMGYYEVDLEECRCPKDLLELDLVSDRQQSLVHAPGPGGLPGGVQGCLRRPAREVVRGELGLGEVSWAAGRVG